MYTVFFLTKHVTDIHLYIVEIILPYELFTHLYPKGDISWKIDFLIAGTQIVESTECLPTPLNKGCSEFGWRNFGGTVG